MHSCLLYAASENQRFPRVIYERKGWVHGGGTIYIYIYIYIFVYNIYNQYIYIYIYIGTICINIHGLSF